MEQRGTNEGIGVGLTKMEREKMRKDPKRKVLFIVREKELLSWGDSGFSKSATS